jgi:enterochelin esterase family protein
MKDNPMDETNVITLTFDSPALASNALGDPSRRRLPVYLPPGYAETDAGYPVIWVLAPFTSWGQRLFNLQAWDENIPQRADRLIRSGAMPPTILAFPDCFTRLGGSQYLNSSAVGRYADYVADELVALVEANFRVLPGRDHRGVVGHSSGGYGALMLAMTRSDVFGAAVSHSGDMAFEFCYWPDIPGAVRAFDELGGVSGFLGSFNIRNKNKDWYSALNLIAMSACYSPNPSHPDGFDLLCDPHTGEIHDPVWARWLALDPLRLAASRLDTLRGLRALYFDCGQRDEYNLFLGARQLHWLLEQNTVPHQYEEFDGGHGGVNWRFDTSLPLLASAIV